MVKISREIKKNLKKSKKMLISLIVLGVILISALFIMGIRIRFEIWNDLFINLNVSSNSYTILNNESSQVKIIAKVDNSMFCTANCTYSFVDRSNDIIVDSGMYYVKNFDELNKNFTLTPRNKGSGQKIYSFNIQCSNIQSTLCVTKSPLRSRSSFITLNYQIRPEEQTLKSELQEMLAAVFDKLNRAFDSYHKTSLILNSTDDLSEDKQIMIQKNGLNTKLAMSLKEAQNLSNLWQDEDYFIISDKLSLNYRRQFYDLNESGQQLLDAAITLIYMQNSQILRYNRLKDDFLNLSLINIYEIDKPHISKNLSYESSSIFDELRIIRITYRSSGFANLTDFMSQINKLSGKYADFKSDVITNSEIINEYGSNLTKMEYSKKCLLGYCQNYTGNVCHALKLILDEYSNTTYQVGSLPYQNYSFFNYTQSGILIKADNLTYSYYSDYCNNSNISSMIEQLQSLGLLDISLSLNMTFDEAISNQLTQNLPQCCAYNKCASCCLADECNDPILYPVLLVHGHSLLRETSPEPLLDIFNKIQYKLQDDGYINAGIVSYDYDPETIKNNEWGLFRMPVVVKASYYYDYFYSLGSYVHITRSSDNIDTYAVRLNDVIRLMKQKTGKPKVNIIAHSMGGLVVRRYIQIFGDESLDKVILIATPNHGVSGNTKTFCEIFGEKKECQDMYDDGVFLKKLNDPNYEPRNARIYTISGSGCDTNGADGDGIMNLNSSMLPYAESYIVKGNCAGIFSEGLHGEILNIDKYPEVYNTISLILNVSGIKNEEVT